MCQKAEVADLGKSARQYVQEKASDKLLSANSEYFLFIIVTAVTIAEPYAVVIDSKDPVVGEILERAVNPKNFLKGKC
jgi:hypothetical protein